MEPGSSRIRNALIVVGLVLALAACQGAPEFINHPAPSLSVAFDEFSDAGCPESKYGGRTCESDSPLAALGCANIREPADLLGGLQPAYPIAVCEMRLHAPSTTAELAAEIDAGEFLYYGGGLSDTFMRYVIFQDGELRLLKSEEDLRRTFAPIESPEEALSYVLAAKGRLLAYYGLAPDAALEYEADTIEDTYVNSEPDGYSLLLYDYAAFGCGPHWTFAVRLHVSADGMIEEVARQQVFRNPDEDGLCAD